MSICVCLCLSVSVCVCLRPISQQRVSVTSLRKNKLHNNPVLFGREFLDWCHYKARLSVRTYSIRTLVAEDGGHSQEDSTYEQIRQKIKTQ